MSLIQSRLGGMTLLMSCRVAGLQHHLGVKFWAQLKAGDVLTLRREPANAHDPRAIRVEWRGAMLGYIPREANFAAAQLMDRSIELTARIGELRMFGDPRERVIIEVSAAEAADEAPLASSHMLDAMVRAPHTPALVLAPDCPATGVIEERALAVLQAAATDIARLLSTPPRAIRTPSGREIQLWDSISISIDSDGRGLDVAHLGDKARAAPRVTLDLRSPVSREDWLEALQPTISRIVREHGLAAALGPLPLAHWLQASLRLTFADFVDFAALREQLLVHLAPDPLTRSLAQRIFAPSPDAAEFNWVCARASSLTILAVEAPRMLPFLHLLQRNRQSNIDQDASAEQLIARLEVLVPRLGADNGQPRALRVLDRPPASTDQAQAPRTAGQMLLIDDAAAA